MEDIDDHLTIKDLTKLLRYSEARVRNALGGRVPGIPVLAHLPMARRKIVGIQWLDQWMEPNKAS